MEKFPISAQLWIQHNFQRILHHKSLLFPAHQQLPESPSQSCDMEAGCAQTPELCSVHWPKVPHPCSAFPCQCHPLLLYFSPQLKPELYNIKSPSVFLPLQDLELLCSIGNCAAPFSWLPAVLPSRLQKGFWFLTLSLQYWLNFPVFIFLMLLWDIQLGL